MPTSSVPMNFKDLIETKATENNIVSMPVIGKQYGGKQLQGPAPFHAALQLLSQGGCPVSSLRADTP